MKLDRERFINDLRELATMDIPWRHRGNLDLPELGMDCVFSPRWAYERQGLRLPDEIEKAFASYRRPPNGRHMLEVMRRNLKEIAVSEMQPADLYVFFVRKNPCHVAVKIDDELIAEAFESSEGATSKFLIGPIDPNRRIAACFRIPDFV